jgi:hypothetical protein
MPTVPSYDSYQVTPNTLPDVKFTAAKPENFAADLAVKSGNAFETLGGELQKISYNMAETTAKDADVAFTPQLNDFLDNPKTGYLNQQGKGAVEGYQPAVDAVTKLKQDHLDSITDPRAREMAASVLSHRTDAAIARINNHASTQTQHWQLQTSQSRADMSLQDAASNYKDPNAFKLSLGTAHNEADEQGRLLGWDEQTTAVQRGKYTDQAYKMKYDAWKQQDAAEALGDFQKNKEQISPLVRDSIGHDLFVAASPQLVQQVNRAGGVSALEAQHSSNPDEPRGVRNNNPGNIMKGSSKWQGEIQGSDPRYASFNSPEAGIAAMGKNLLTYQNKYGINTVEGIVSRWAPATENNTNTYTATVAKALGVKPGDTIDLHDPETLGKLTHTMIQQENGKQPYSDAQISAGLGVALGNAKLPEVQTPPIPETPVPSWRDPLTKTGNPIIDKLPPDQRIRVLQLAQSQIHQDTAQLRDALQSRTQDVSAEYLTNGAAKNPPGESDFIRAYGQTEGVQRFRTLQDTAKLGTELQNIKIASNTDLARMVKEAKPLPGEGFASRERNYEILQHAVKTTQDQRRQDPIASAMSNPAYGIDAIHDFSNPKSMAESLGKRKDAMGRIAGDYETPPAILTEKEADAFGQYLGTLQATDKARVLGQVFDATGAEGVQSVSRQLKDKNDALAIAAMLTRYTEPSTSHFFSEATPGRNVAQLYLQGKEAIEQKLVKVDEAKEVGTKAQINAALDGVYQTPQGRNSAAEAAFGVWAKYKADGKDDVEKAIDMATGGVMDHNNGKIAKPFGWQDSRFSDALRTSVPTAIEKAGRDIIVKGQKLKAAEFAKMIPGARLQTYGQGTYLVMSGNDVARNEDGSPYILRVAD